MTTLYVHTSFDADPPPWFKGQRSTRRSGAVVTAWCAHQTAVAGSFDVPDRAVARHGGDRWAALLERYSGSEYLSEQEIEADPKSDGKVGVPYHYVYRPADDVLIALWHPALYSWHGNGSNAFAIGFAVDGKYPGDEVDTGAIAEAFTMAIEHAEGEGFTPSELDAHRQHSSGRGSDPGAELWPILETVGCEFDVRATITRTTGSGSAVPDSWRPASSVVGVGVMRDFDAAAAGADVSDLKSVQGLLLARGFDPHGVDGIWGPNTASALASFRAARELGSGTFVHGRIWVELLRG